MVISKPVPERLYDYRFSGNSYKVRLALSQLGIKVQIQSVDIVAGESQTGEFRSLNPLGQIPVLVLSDGTCLRESNSILFWLAKGTPLFPELLSEQTEVLQWLFFEQSNIDKVLGRTRFLRAFPAFRTPAAHEWDEWYRVGNEALSVMDRHLLDREFLVGGTYSIADISLYGYVHSAAEGGFNLSRFHSVLRWVDRVESLPGYIGQMDGDYP